MGSASGVAGSGPANSGGHGSGAVESPEQILDALQALTAADIGGLPDAALLDRLRDAVRVQRAAQALVVATVGVVHARGAGGYDGCPSTKAWMRSQLRMSSADAGAFVEAATALPDLPRFAAAFAAGGVGLDHVGVLAELRKKTDSLVAGVGDRVLAGYAAEEGARQLRRLAGQVREHFQAENDADRPLEPERFLSLGQTFEGVWGLRGALSPEGGAMLRTALDAAMTRPAPEDDRSVAERRHDAFIELIRLGLDSAELPERGGEAVHLGVLVPLADLRDAQERHAADEQGRGARRRAAPGVGELPEEIAAYLAALDRDDLDRDDLDRDDLDEDGPDGDRPDGHRPDRDGLDGDGLVSGPVGSDAERPLYVPEDWSAALADWCDVPVVWDEGLAAWVPEYDDLIIAEETVPPEEGDLEADADAGSDSPLRGDPLGGGRSALGGQDSPVLTDLQLALPGLGVNASRLPRAGQGARTDYGDWLSAAAARRLACEGAIYRVVFGPRDVPLSAGQRTRLVPPSLRRILVARDGGCRFPGCDRPPAYTQAHHVRFWADGGPTTSTNLVLLCGFHHHRVHDHGWNLHYDPVTNIVTVQRPDGTPLRLPGEP